MRAEVGKGQRRSPRERELREHEELEGVAKKREPRQRVQCRPEWSRGAGGQEHAQDAHDREKASTGTAAEEGDRDEGQGGGADEGLIACRPWDSRQEKRDGIEPFREQVGRDGHLRATGLRQMAQGRDELRCSERQRTAHE